MKQTIDYSALTGKAKYDKALKDCRNYLGRERYNDVLKLLEIELQRGHVKNDYLLGCMGMIGIEGYPAQAMIDAADGGYIGE